MNIAVECRDVTKIFGTGETAVAALQGVTLDVRCNELLMLVGPSGCGKTTLISIIAGILYRNAGQCTVFGRDPSQLSSHSLTTWRGENVGFIFQQFNLLPALTVKENIAVPLILLGESWERSMQLSGELAEAVGLGNHTERLPSQLSGGQQQRVAIARALVHRPRLVVADEPTSSLDHETGEKVMNTLRKLAVGPERALVVVTHDARVFPFADRIAHLDDGRTTRIEEQRV